MDALLPLLLAVTAAAWATVGGRRGKSPAWLPSTVDATVGPDGVQEVAVVVHGGYRPARIRVRAGIPVRLVFDRREDDPCSARVFFSEPRIERALPPFAATTVAFTPRRVGDHLFTCEEGRFRGRLAVVPSATSAPPRRGRSRRSQPATEPSR